MAVAATKNRRVVLRRRPEGILAPGDTELVTEAVPTGVDLFFDNVGGALLNTVLRQGRVVICGARSQYTGTAPPDILRTARERTQP
jgi:hypothetical protein